MTTKELEAMLANVPAEAMQGFIQRGMLLAQLNSLDSKVSNIRAQQAEAMRAAEAEIDALNAERAKLQEQLNAL